MPTNSVHRKIRSGIVISDKMDKTITVKVERFAEHALYGKRVRRAKKYHVHDEQNTCRIGDEVRIGETRPLSKTKRWELLEITRRAPILGGSAEDSSASEQEAI